MVVTTLQSAHITLTVTLSASPASGIAPLNDVDLTADVDGTATGNIHYQFDCTNNGSWDRDVISTLTDPYTWLNGCDYSPAGTYTAMVFVTRNGLTASATTTVTVNDSTITVSGTVYDDPTGAAGGLNKCIGPYVAPLKPGGGSVKVLVNPDAREGPVEGNGTYQVNQVLEVGAKTIILQNMDPEYQCTCPTGCQYASASVAGGDNSGWDFFVSQIRPRWLKVFGGSAHVQGNLISNAPSGDVFMADFAGDGPGALTKNSGSTVSFGAGSLSSQPSWNFTDQLSAGAWKYGYQAMWLRAGNPSTDPGDGANPPAAGVYRKSGNYVISGSWGNLGGSRAIFVQGDVTINTSITLSNGAFLAIIASGNITVDPTVGNATSKANPTAADANLVGAFFANGNFTGGTTGVQTDKQLVIYGSVAADAELNGAGKVSSQRDLGIGNASFPGTAFIWNPFLI
ncbi:hypothetical protein HYU89_00670 [Candidatus Collierbacteria bacterium]|nr:hypothetical protein [Candidatus Collierbacteria bacterium]